MKYTINFDKRALKQISKIEKDKKLLKRFLEILEDLEENPFSPKFKFERLKHNFSGFCAKRLDQKNRVIYRVVDETVEVLVVSVLGHYKDN